MTSRGQRHTLLPTLPSRSLLESPRSSQCEVMRSETLPSFESDSFWENVFFFSIGSNLLFS
jgi:hypothetical protein